MNKLNLKANLVSRILMLPVIFCLSSCTYIIVAGLGAAGGYVVSPDTVEGVAEMDELTVWESAVEVSSVMGLISEKYEDGGVIISKIHGTNVTVNITPLTENSVKLTVKARKFYFPKIAIAQEVFVKIMTELEE